MVYRGNGGEVGRWREGVEILDWLGFLFGSFFGCALHVEKMFCWV